MKRIAPLGFSALLLALTGMGGTCALAAESEWVLEQKADTLGKIVVYVSHDAVKIVSPLWGYELLSKAPTWTVHCYRPREKIEWVGELTAFSGAMINSPFKSGGANTTKLFPFGTGVMKGLKYTRYSLTKNGLAALYGSDEIAIAPKAAEFLARCNDLPDCGKVPIYRTQFKVPDFGTLKAKESWLAIDAARDMRTGFVIEVSTQSCKKLPFNAADFAGLPGCRRLNSIEQVAYSSKQKEDLTEMFKGDGVGFAADLNGGQKKQRPGTDKPRSK